MGDYKIYIVCILLLVGGYMINKHTTAPPPPEPGTYFNDQYGFSIKFPDGWPTETLFEDDVWTITAMEPNHVNDLYYTTVRVAVEELPYKVKTRFYHERYLETTRTSFRNFRLLESKKIEVAGKDVEMSVVSYESEGDRVQSLWYVITKDGIGYLVICMAPPHRFGELKEQFEKAAHSFNLG